MTHLEEMSALADRIQELVKAARYKPGERRTMKDGTVRVGLPGGGSEVAERPKKKGRKKAEPEPPAAPATEDVLRAMGGKRSERDGRYYFNNLHALAGFVAERYGSGNISGATLNGQSLSNSRAAEIDYALQSGKAWWDPTDQRFHASLGGTRRGDMGAGAAITQTLRARFVAAGGVGPAAPAPTPAATPTPAAKPHAAPPPAPHEPTGPKFRTERDGRRVYILGETSGHGDKMRGIHAKYDSDRGAWYTLDEGVANQMVERLNRT